jgi:hypothetical protein
MSFIILHQKGKRILVSADCIKIISRQLKGTGSFIVTDLDGQDLEVDETVDDLVARLTELEIDVDLFANDQ